MSLVAPESILTLDFPPRNPSTDSVEQAEMQSGLAMRLVRQKGEGFALQLCSQRKPQQICYLQDARSEGQAQ